MILMSTFNMPLFYWRSKASLNHPILPPDLALWLTRRGLNYPCLELISMVPKMFKSLKFNCIYLKEKNNKVFLWQNKISNKVLCNEKKNTVELRWFEPLWAHENLFEPRKATISATTGGTMEIIVGYLFGVLYFKCMLCVLIRIAS